MLLAEHKKTVTVSGGSGFFSIPCWQGEIALVSVVPSNLAFEYDVRIRNTQNVDIEDVDDVTGTYLDRDLRIPVRGNLTLYLENASNGNYEVYVEIIEKA